MKRVILGIIGLSMVVLAGCTRIESGEVGVRINASKQVEGTELQPGSWNQNLIGQIMTFPVREIALVIDNKTPMTADNTALADLDLTVIYNLNPTSVSELYTAKSPSFHSYDEKSKDTFLMFRYMETVVNNASYKAIRDYKALEVADNRQKLEATISSLITERLKAEKLDTSITVSSVQIRNILPNADILRSATEYVKSQNELKIKENEVAIAKKEAERMSALSNQSQQAIAYMNAQASLNISEGIKNGKVNTIIVPSTFNGLMIGK